jgi:tRNA dimethylallyltransferase
MKAHAMQEDLPFYLSIAGPTAAGKTAAALAVARAYDCEIISVDSALVYQGMDIGTAKPRAHELAAVPHHLIDIRDPLHAYNAAEFARDAAALIRAISARGKLPLLVGGTMLYFKALFEPLDAMPAADPAIRAAIEQEAQTLGWPALHAQLAQVDPATAARLAPADSQRVGRALEVWRSAGVPLSQLQLRSQQSAQLGEPCKPHAPLISLEPQDRAWLHARIAERFDTMLAQGLVQEVQGLRARGDLHAALPSMRCVGYRQVWEVLDGTTPAAQLRDKGIFATRQLAKRQITWLRSMPQRQVIACDHAQSLGLALATARRLVEGAAL